MKLFKSLVVLCLLVLTLSAKLRKEEKDNNCCFYIDTTTTPKKYKVYADTLNTCSSGKGGIQFKHIPNENNCSVANDALKINKVKNWADSHPLN